MKILCLLALAAVASMARGMTDDNDPPQRILEKAGASFGDAADYLTTLRPGGGASVEVGRSQEDENAVPGVLQQLGEGFGNAAASIRNGGFGGLVALATSSQQNEASDERDAKRLCVRPGADGEAEEDDAEEEAADSRQKLRIDATGRIARVVEFRDRGHLLIELEGPELELDTTRTTHVTFLDEDGNEVAFDEIRRTVTPKFLKRDRIAGLLKDIKRWAGAYDEATPLTESDIKAKVIPWSKIDASNVLEIKVEDAPVVDVSETLFAKIGGKGGPKQRQQVHKYLLHLRAQREKNHPETPKPTHHLEKGVDDLYDPETNWFRYSVREWRDGSGRKSVWEAVSKKIEEVDAPRCPHTNLLASADVHRDECPTKYFHDEEFQEKLGARSLEGLTGEEVDHSVYPPGSYIFLPHMEGFEGIYGYVHTSDGRLYWSYQFKVRNQGAQYSPLFYDTKEEASDARTEAMDAFPWPPFLTDGFTTDPRKRTKRSYIKDVAFYFAIKEGDVPDPWSIGFGDDYKEYDNPKYRYHGTSLLNLLANLEDIKKRGLLLRALCDDPATNIPHSRCGEKLWACATMRNCFAHMRSDMTISRHVKNELNTYDKWFEVAILALPAAGWEKKFMPEYRFSGYYSKGPVVPVACLRVNLLEGKAELEKLRKWARDGHPDGPDSCWPRAVL